MSGVYFSFQLKRQEKTSKSVGLSYSSNS